MQWLYQSIPSAMEQKTADFKYVEVKVKVVVSLRSEWHGQMWEGSISDSNVCERNTKTLEYKGGRGFGHESYGKERGRNKEARTMEGNNFHPQGLVQIFLH